MNPKKKFGQNFITDKNLIAKIVDEAQIVNKNVIEVGPGRGALTNYLVKQAKQVIAYEIDQDLKFYLDEIENENKNFKAIYDDFLSVEFDLEGKWELIGNLPYYITTPILFKFIENELFSSATMMMQKEVGERIVSKPNSKKYNALSVIIQYLTDVVKVLNVSRKMFYPVPEVDSVVLKFTKKENRYFSLKQEKKFLEFVKASFTQKRKTLANNISDYYHLNKQQFIALLRNLNYNENIRAEQLSVEEFILLFKGFNDETFWESLC